MNKEQRSILATKFRSIILSIPRAKRKDTEDDINYLRLFFAIDEDLVNVDKRGKHWSERSEEEKLEVKRKQIEKARLAAAELRAKVKAERAKVKEYRMTCRGNWEEDVDIVYAAKILNLSPQSIYNKMAKSPNRIAHYVVDDQVYSIKKIK